MADMAIGRQLIWSVFGPRLAGPTEFHLRRLRRTPLPALSSRNDALSSAAFLAAAQQVRSFIKGRIFFKGN